MGPVPETGPGVDMPARPTALQTEAFRRQRMILPGQPAKLAIQVLLAKLSAHGNWRKWLTVPGSRWQKPETTYVAIKRQVHCHMPERIANDMEKDTYVSRNGRFTFVT